MASRHDATDPDPAFLGVSFSCTAFPRSLDPFHIVALCLKWVKTSWTDRMHQKSGGKSRPLKPLEPLEIDFVATFNDSGRFSGFPVRLNPWTPLWKTLYPPLFSRMHENVSSLYVGSVIMSGGFISYPWYLYYMVTHGNVRIVLGYLS